MPDDTKPRQPPEPQPRSVPPRPRVKLTIDDREVEVDAGTNLLEAARAIGVQIPHYCYHPRLSIAASCRMCLVEASNSPKPVPACQMPATECLVVQTRSALVKEAQRATLEFLLLNHPVDCAVCDQAGECKLQDYYQEHDAQPSRLAGPKIQKEKRRVLGPLVTLDQERCILCTRCVRFMCEVAGEPQLGVFGRGSHEAIDTFPDKPLDSNYAGNTVDLCPVGALTSSDFRFTARAFFLTATPSVCTGCARGCSVWLDHFNGETYRYRPRENPAVNGPWMCDVGRLSYKPLVHDRALEVKIGRAGEGRTAEGREAARVAIEKLKPLAGDEHLAFVASPTASVEDLLATFRLASEGLGLKRVFVSGRAADKGDRLLLREDRNPNRLGLEWVAQAFGLKVEPFEKLAEEIDAERVEGVLAVGEEVPTDPKLVASLLLNLDPVIVLATNLGPVAGMGHVLLPSCPCSEDDGTFVNFEGHAQRFVAAYRTRGQSRPHWTWAATLLEELGVEVGWRSARDVFAELAPRVAQLAGFDWASAPGYLTHPRGLRTLPAAADARHGIHRERS